MLHAGTLRWVTLKGLLALLALTGLTGMTCRPPEYLTAPRAAWQRNWSNQEQEPNNDFGQAVARLMTDATMTIEGRIGSPSDIDIFDIGPTQPGDHLVVDLDTVSGDLDSIVAVFDQEHRLLSVNDDVDDFSFDSRVEFTARHATVNTYIAVASWDAQSMGGYVLDLTLTRGGPAPDTVPQTVYLDFDGADTHIPSIGEVVFGAFDAANIDASYDGQTDPIKAGILDAMEADYAGFNITFLSSDDEPVPAGSHATLYFGGTSPDLFGIAEHIDDYNAEASDAAVIYTDSWCDAFVANPSVDGLARSIGQVASHELGHLLGLNHVADVTDLMDTTGEAETLLDDQVFKLSVVAAQVFPIGMQDAALLLREVLGRR